MATPANIIGAIQMQRGIVIKNKLRHLDLFSGIGGFSLGLEATGGFETVAFCEIEEFPRKVLQKHWPHVKKYTDIKELTYDRIKADGIGPIDIITGGYPCQPFSVAGRKKGEEDPRHLWPEYFRIIKELRPNWIIGENVAGHIKLGLDTVLQNLESEGYQTRAFSISASAIGANHKRERVWVVANANSGGNKGEESRSIGKKKEEETSNRKIHSTTRFPDGTDSTVTQQGSETKVEYVEDTRRSLRQGSFIREKNENEIGKENANLSQRSGEASEFDVANTESKRTRKNDEGLRTRSGRASGRETADVANTESIGSYGGENKNNQQETENKKIKGKARGVSGNMANPYQQNVQATPTSGNDGEDEKKSPNKHDRGRSPTPGGKIIQGNWDVEPKLGRVADGIPNRVDRLKALGNSLVPQVPYYLGLSILESVKDA